MICGTTDLYLDFFKSGGLIEPFKAAMFSMTLANGLSTFLSTEQQYNTPILTLLFQNSTHGAGPFFANLSFLLLFLAMALYWMNLAFGEPFSFSDQKGPKTKAGEMKSAEGDCSAAIPNTLVTNLNAERQSSFFFSLTTAQRLAIYGANICLFVLLCVRWQESGHFPLSNLYESLMFLSWSCTSIHIFLFLTLMPFQNSSAGEQSLFNPYGVGMTSQFLFAGEKNSAFLEKLLGSVLAPSALFLNAFATFSLPPEMQEAGPLVPALQSNWLMMHVTVMIISYSALMLGSLLSIAYLIYSRLIKPASPAGLEQKVSTVTSNPKSSTFDFKVTDNLDYLSYRIIGIGFPFLTIGILSGAVWANEAWGSYWSWDPKETWALLTWLVFAIYLHTRLQKGWEGEKPAMLASLGFVVVWVCYLGVNLLGEGLHSYGFLS